jgi:glycosyltransferase involved in cell wall biosynthesis
VPTLFSKSRGGLKESAKAADRYERNAHERDTVLKALTVRGPFHGPTGYDHHVREFVREFRNRGIAVELVDLPFWSPARLPKEMQEPWLESLDQDCGARTVLHFSMPHQVFRYPDRVNANYTMFEATRVPASWVEANKKHDVLILPTESSKSAWMASGLPEHRIRICPLGVNPEVFTGQAAPLELEGVSPEKHRVRFLNVSAESPRKNLLGLLEAWARATSRSDDAILIVKLGCYDGAPERFQQELRALSERLPKKPSEAAPVRFVYDLFSDADMPRFYAAGTHYISMSHGEGWDQTMMEAAASGLKLIAPAHSAYLTYLDPTIASLIRTREIPIVYQGDPATADLFVGANWWEPDMDHAIELIRAAIDGRDSSLSSARERIVRDFTWASAASRLIEILDEVESLKEKIRVFSPPPRKRE